MDDYTILERLIKIFKLVTSSPFFILLAVIILLTLVLAIIFSKLRDDRPKILAGIGYLCIIAYVFAKYGTFLKKAGDTFVDSLFMLLYFPNLLVFIAVVLLFTILMIVPVILKRIKGFMVFINIIFAMTIQFFFILILDLIKDNNVNLLEKTSVYKNESITVLVQASMAIIAIWVVALFINFVIDKIANKVEESNKKQIELDKIEIDDDFKEYKKKKLKK